jgi:hypothetical protein
MPMSSTWTSCEYAVWPSRRNWSTGFIGNARGRRGLLRSVAMIGRPNVQPVACWRSVAAGPPVHSHSQSLMQVVVWPVGSCWKLSSRSRSGFFASTT